VSLGHGSALLVVSAVLVHMVTHVTERLGFSLGQVATVVVLLTIAQIAGHLGGGWAGDRISKRAIVVGCMLGHATALALLARASAYWMVVVFAIVHGLSWGTRGPLMAGCGFWMTWPRRSLGVGRARRWLGPPAGVCRTRTSPPDRGARAGDLPKEEEAAGARSASARRGAGAVTRGRDLPDA
jgi:MFS family permease